MISIFAAIDSKNGLGKNNQLLVKIPADFARMKKLTSHHPIIMGRKTFESIGRVLPDRTNIIVTTNVELDIENAIVVNSLDMALEAAGDADGSEEIFIFGGGQIFKEAIERGIVDRLYLTKIDGDYGADTFFPDYSEFGKIISEEDGEQKNIKYKFVILER